MPDQQRKIVFFLGAGASLGAGAFAQIQGGGKVSIPTQVDFWGTFLRFCSSKKRRAIIESFLFRYFLGYDRLPARLQPRARRQALHGIDVEEVFTFLSERIGATGTPQQFRTYARNIWKALLSEIGPVFARFGPNRQTRQIYRQFAKNHLRSWDTVVSFNYDTVFEKSLPHKRRWYYERVQGGGNRAVGILKPHGSANWCNGTAITIDENPSTALIVAPTHLKFVKTAKVDGAGTKTANVDGDAETMLPDLVGYLDQSPQIRDVWAAMEREMRTAKALVFIGYSFPVSDLYFSSILRSVLVNRDQGTPAFVIVNPDATSIAARLRARFHLEYVTNYFEAHRESSVGRFEG